MNRRSVILPLLFTNLLFAQDPVTIALENFATGLDSPVDIAHCGDERLFVVEQAGTIRVVLPTGVVVATPFLDIVDRVNDGGGEQGLLGLAFDPAYQENGRFYVYYTAGSGNGSSRVSRFTVTEDPALADPASEEILFTFAQPASNHNGGDLAFGPDGYLYIGFGDGGSANDPWNNGQTLTNPLGDILRLDVSGESGYVVPSGNPWVGLNNDTLPEIWASGLRNPWRFGFDALTGDLWIGDVGQGQQEEVDFWPAGDNSGPNFGWRCYEGNIPTPGINDDCPPASAFVPPISVHTHAEGWCSVIGGRVYRGAEFPRLFGLYIYTDYCPAPYYAIRPDGEEGWIRTQVRASNGGTGTSAIAENSTGELFVANTNAGTVKRIVDQCPMPAPTIALNGDQLISSPADTYTWLLNGEEIPDADTQVIVPEVPGSYSVVAGFGASCQLTSAPLQVNATSITAAAMGRFTALPIPAQELITLDGVPVEAVRLELVDMAGKQVRTLNVNASPRRQIGVSDLRNGNYLLRLIDADGAIVDKRMVQVQH
ncbi:MAG: PQQ-dependent sugar dehydrogenase [Flavobacteriales bacterium]|nr:PQQ-dependent sugar dehydrogenase [Flavobacteriales bacterium]HPF89673.1 PQQ-dependent sugar dehydrogenase [Flavobacteriales bacterium]